MNAEENMAALQNSVIYGFVSNVYSVNSGSLILVSLLVMRYIVNCNLY